jgi:HSP20 family protein
MTLIKKTNGPEAFFPSVFDDFFTKDFFVPFKMDMPQFSGSQPAVNVKETEKSFHIELAAPGLEKGDFKVEVDKNVLTISAEKETKKEEKDKEGRYTRREFGYTSFKRSFTLSEDLVDGEKVDAKYENGVLHVDLPKKKEQTKAIKQISVK